MHDVFRVGSLVGFHEQSFFLPSKVRLMGRLPVISVDLLRSGPRRLQSEVTNEPPGPLTSNPYQLPKE